MAVEKLSRAAIVVLTAMALTYSTHAMAAVTTFKNPVDFSSALGPNPVVTETFETLPADTIISAGNTINEITYNTFPTAFGGLVTDAFLAIGTNGLALERDGIPGTNTAPGGDFFFPGDSFSVSFSAPVKAVGIYFLVDTSLGASDFFITTTVGDSHTGNPATDLVMLPGGDPAFGFSEQFFAGLISDTPFLTTIFGKAPVGTMLPNNGGWSVDNLTYSTVPEPSALTLLAVGILLTVYVRRYRNHRYIH